MRTDRQTDGHDEASRRSSQLCERAQKKNRRHLFYTEVIAVSCHIQKSQNNAQLSIFIVKNGGN